MNKPSRMKLTAPLTVLLFALCNLTVVRADVKPAALFGDHISTAGHVRSGLGVGRCKASRSR